MPVWPLETVVRDLVLFSGDRIFFRHQYVAEQVEHIKKVLVLRSLGLSIASISRLHEGNTDLSEIIAEYKAKLIALLSIEVTLFVVIDCSFSQISGAAVVEILVAALFKS